MASSFKWCRQARDYVEKHSPKGKRVPFQDGDVDFYITEFRAKGMKPRNMVFRVHPGRIYLDRLHWWFCQERDGVPMSNRYNIRRIRPANDADVWRWMSTHFWTMAQKGFPLHRKWRRMIDKDEYAKQLPIANPVRFSMDFRTLKVKRVRG